MRFTFLLCSERSGSNLLARMMDSHPQVCGPPPSHLIRTFALNILRYGDLARDENWRALTEDVADLLANQLGRWRFTPAAKTIRQTAKERTLEAVVRLAFEGEARSAPVAADGTARPKERVFVKENQLWRFLPFLVAAFPEARYVYLVRDPRDMALSWKLSPNHPGGVARGAAVWKQDQEQSILALGFLKWKGRIHLLRYEDLIGDPEAELTRLCGFHGIPYSAEMLSFHRSLGARENAARLKDWQNLARPLLSDNLGKYKSALDADEIGFVESLCAAEMAFFGYAPDLPPGNLGERAARLLAKEGAAAPAPPPVAPLDEAERLIRERRLAIVKRILARPLAP